MYVRKVSTMLTMNKHLTKAGEQTSLALEKAIALQDECNELGRAHQELMKAEVDLREAQQTLSRIGSVMCDLIAESKSAISKRADVQTGYHRKEKKGGEE